MNKSGATPTPENAGKFAALTCSGDKTFDVDFCVMGITS
jgi:hypothetical protein